MEKENLVDRIAQIEEMLETLPIKAQEAFCWAIENLDELKYICDDPELDLADLPDMMAKAWKEENYTLFVLLCISKVIKELKENEET